MARRNEPTGGPAGAFDRDFGYLLPFLDKVTAVASQLPDAAARGELQRLMADEKQRWARVRELLSGAQGAGAPGAAPGLRGPGPMPGRGSPELSPQAARPGAPQLTVGSLKPPR
jgi:hypothetical protein